MGTSANRDRVKPGSPLLPDWILPPDQNEPDEGDPEENDRSENEPASDEQGESIEQRGNNDHVNSEEGPPLRHPLAGNRFNISQRGFRMLVNGQNVDRGLLNRVVKNYVSRAGGGPRTMARRMQRSSNAIIRLGRVLTDIQRNGLQTALQSLHLDNYVGRPALDVLSALINAVCGVGALLDDAVTNQAYVNTVIKISMENPNLDMENLNAAQIAEMLAVFLEESIVCRLICDVGRSLTTATTDVERSRQIEIELYQLVEGLVHTEIVPRIEASLHNIDSLQREMNSIYEIAFSCIIQ